MAPISLSSLYFYALDSSQVVLCIYLELVFARKGEGRVSHLETEK